MLGEVLVDQNIITTATLVRALADLATASAACQLRHGLIDPALLKA